MIRKYILILSLTTTCYLYPQQIQWVDTFSYSDNLNVNSHNGNVNVKSISLDPDGNIYVAGGFGSPYCCGSNGVYWRKYDLSKNILNWDTISCPPNTNITDAGAINDMQKNLLIILRCFSNFKMDNSIYPPQTYLIKRNSSGQITWALPQNSEFPFHIEADRLNNIYVASDYNNGSVKKYDTNGFCTNTIASSGYIALDTVPNLFIMSLSLRKYNQNGSLLWTYPNIPGNSQFTVDVNGNSFVHEDNSPNGSTLKKINSQGQLIWSTPLWMTATGGICLYSNYVYLAGVSGNDNIGKNIELRKIDFNGNIIWAFQISVGSYLEVCYPKSLRVNQEGVYIAASQVEGSYAILIKVSEPDNILTNLNLPTKKNESSLIISPNPSSSRFNISFKSQS
jgi:hypothetical protein